MSFNFTNKLLIILIFPYFISSCQDRINAFDKEIDLENEQISKIENIEKIDLSINQFIEINNIDYYSNGITKYDFLKKDLEKFKINNYETNYDNETVINIIFNENNIYSLNYKGEILKFDPKDGSLIEKFNRHLSEKNEIPVSFSLYENDFIIGFKSGKILRTNKNGEIKWKYIKNSLLNTPIKIHEDNLIILFPEDLIILSPVSGELIYEKNFKSSNIIQSSGGKIVNYFNLIYFLLPNSEFHSFDTFLFQEHFTKLSNIEVTNSLNNLNDKIYIFKNYFVYIDNGNVLYTYDLIKNKYLLSRFRINNNNSNILFNNSLISLNKNYLEIYNLKNANLFSKINVEKTLTKNSSLIKAITINNKLHLFTDKGDLLIINKQYKIEKYVNLKIKNINKIYNYQDKIFISTNKGNTFLY